MRFHLVARRIILAPALALALVVAVAACSSSSGTSSSSPPATSAPASSAPASPNTATAAAQITANWEKFFNSSTSTSQRVTLLQNGSTFAAAIAALAKLPLASGIGAKVTNVTVNNNTAIVTYNITSGSSSLLSGQTGTAVYQNGTWKVGDASLCGLFKLVPGGTVPAACNTAT
jgi:hypothetical protein